MDLIIAIMGVLRTNALVRGKVSIFKKSQLLKIYRFDKAGNIASILM